MTPAGTVVPTGSQLLIVLNSWLSNFDINIAVDVIYTDIAKAFDTVSHSKLITILKSYGVPSDYVVCLVG